MARHREARYGAEWPSIDVDRCNELACAAAIAGELRAAFRQHHFLLLRQPALGEADQIRFTKLFGKLLIRNSDDASAGKEAYYISNSRPDGVLPQGEIEFHHDQVFFQEPLKAAFLYAIEVPSSGSATRFRNAGALLDKLPAPSDPAWRSRERIRTGKGPVLQMHRVIDSHPERID